MENLNESKTTEGLESRAAVEEYELAEVSLANAATQKANNKKSINWIKVGVAGTLACSVLSLGLSCAALVKKSKDANNNNDQSTNVSHGESYSVSEDGYLVIDGVKTDVKIDTASDIIDAEIVPVDKWGISTFIKFTFDDGSYMTTTPKTQIMNDHYYDVSSAADIEALTTYGAPKMRLTNHVNVTTVLEFDADVEINLNNKTMMYTATSPITVAENATVKLANGHITFNTAKAMKLNKAATLEIADATVQAQGTIAEVAGDDAKVEIFDSSISSTGKVVDVADTANNFVLNVEDTELETADAGNVYVSTEEALRAAMLDVNVTEITLSTNIDFETGVFVKRDVTVNLNGKTLTAVNDVKGNGIFCVWSGAKLTIEGNGTLNSACQTNNSSMAIWAYGGEVVINGGTYTNVGAKSIDDTEPNNNELIYANNGGKITINAGKFYGNSENATHGTRYTLNIKDNSNSDIIVKGGTFYAYDPSASASESPIANWVALGYKVVEEDGAYTVVEEAGHIYVTTYADLVSAVANTEVETITIATNINLDTAVYVKRNVIIDLNGKTLTATQDPNGYGLFCVFTGAKLTINGEGTVNSACQTNDYSIAVWAYGGEVVINGGTYTNVGAKDHDSNGANNNELIYVNNGGKITINGGTFIGNTENDTHGAKYTLNSQDEKTSTPARESGDIIVKGGTFYAYDPSASASESPTANWVAEGFTVVEDNGVFTVVAE